mgnify:CR=1 FL=1
MTTMSHDPSEPDDLELFRQATQGARRIKVDQADTGKARTDRTRIKTLRQGAVQPTNRVRVDGMSDQFVIDVLPEEELSWAAN